jgi:hypothetical protein
MKPHDPLLCVVVYLRGDLLNPIQLSRAIGTEPTDYRIKGEWYGQKRKVRANIGIWSLEAQSISASTSDHIDELLDKFDRFNGSLHKISGVEDAYLDIFVAFDGESGKNNTVEFVLSKKQMEKLNRLGLSIQFTTTNAGREPRHEDFQA